MPFENITLPLTLLENKIYNEFDKYYLNWKNKLTNDANNIYSLATKEKIDSIEKKIFNSFLLLITSVVEIKNIPQFFEKKIKNTLLIANVTDIEFDNLLDLYHHINFRSHQKILFNEIMDFNNILNQFNDGKKKTQSKILNYNRYLDKNYYNSSYNNDCLICYGSQDLIKTQLICGHCICIECILNTIAKSNECPICKEFITIEKIAIIKESIPNYKSNIINYLINLDPYTIILSDIKSLNNIFINTEKRKTNIIDITKADVMNKLKKINKIQKIVLFTSQNLYDNFNNTELELIKIINYFELFNEKPIIYKLNIVSQSNEYLFY